MGRNTAGLQKKKVTVHGRKGTYQRSVMVRRASAKSPVRQGAPKPGRLARALTGKTGMGTHFRVGLLGGALHGAAGIHRIHNEENRQLASTLSSFATHGAGLVAVHRRDQHAAHGFERIGHILSNAAGQTIGRVGGVLAHEGVRRGISRFSHTG